MSRQAIGWLNDEQVRMFIADGLLVVDSGLDSTFHRSITEELSLALKHESRWLGDNLVPRVPQLTGLLEAPAVFGAVASLLGNQFAWAPHRFPHNSEPLDTEFDEKAFNPFENQPRMGDGSISGSGWHQDGHSKAGRSRWHTLRAINVFYFPHDCSLEMGPTRLLAGTHLYATLRNIVPEQVVYEPIRAGTVILADFDLGHAGTPNRTDQSRYMLKFVALRMENPSKPNWDHSSSGWKTPADLRTPERMPIVWHSLWNWLCGVPRTSGLNWIDSSTTSRLLDELKSIENIERLTALYSLVTFGESVVPDLCESLLMTAGLDRHVSPSPTEPGYAALSSDHLERRFSQRQFVPEDSAIALGAIGISALPSVVKFLEHDDPWIRINAAYAIGEMGNDVPASIADKIGDLLDDPLDAVVRVALDALMMIPTWGSATLAKIHRLFTETVPGGEYAAMGEPRLGGNWTIQNQIRYVAAWAMRSRILAANIPDRMEETLITALHENTGYTPAVACEALERLQSVEGLKAAVRYLKSRRWDPASFERRQKNSKTGSRAA